MKSPGTSLEEAVSSGDEYCASDLPDDDSRAGNEGEVIAEVDSEEEAVEEAAEAGDSEQSDRSPPPVR